LLSSRRRHTRSKRHWSSDVCSSDLQRAEHHHGHPRSGRRRPGRLRPVPLRRQDRRPRTPAEGLRGCGTTRGIGGVRLMLRLSWNTFRQSWSLFVGSFLTVAIGVALVQASILNLVTAAGVTAPDHLSTLERAQLLDSYDLAVPVIGITLALAVFLTIFIVSSTFAFTVAQRKRDLALLRLTGGSRQQVRRLLLSEATILGLLGTLVGIRSDERRVG